MILQNIVRWAVALALLAVLGACSLPRGAALQQEIVGARTDPEARFQVVPVSPENVGALADWPVTGWRGHYRWFAAGRGPVSPIIRAGDTITLTVWDSQETSLLTTADQRNAVLPDMTVSPSGTVFVPYVDEVDVRGLTPTEARARIQDAMTAIVPSAQVQLTHQPGRQNTVDAVRGVASPGSYPVPDRNYTILSLISEAGGISTDLRNPLVRVIRDGQTYEIRAETLLGDAGRNVLLRGGDKVIVDEDQRSFIALGATGREELVYFTQERLSTLEALAIVGGLSDNRADLNGVLILRQYGGDALRADGSGPEKQQVVFTFDLSSADGLFAARNFRVNPEDVVVATESPVTSARTILGLIGSGVGVRNALNND